MESLSVGASSTLYDEGDPSSLHGGGAVSRTFGLLYRQDFGDAVSGGGVEVEGGLDLTMPGGLHLDLQGRILLGHADELDDWGLSGGVTWRERGDGRGLSVLFEPQWGNPASNAAALWERGSAGLSETAALSSRHGLRVQYGWPVLGGTETLDLYARGAFGDSRALGFGADMQLRDGLELGYESLLRSSDADAAADHRVRLRFQSRF